MRVPDLHKLSSADFNLDDSASVTTNSVNSRTVYYMCSFTVALFCLLPIFISLAGIYGTRSSCEQQDLDHTERDVFVACFAIALPLLLEFTIDFLIGVFHSTGRKVDDDRFGHLVMLLSLLVSGVVLPIDTEYSTPNLLQIVYFGQTIAWIGVCGKLRIFDGLNWRTWPLIFTTTLYAGVQVLLGFSTYNKGCKIGSNNNVDSDILNGVALAVMALILVISVRNCRSYVLSLRREGLQQLYVSNQFDGFLLAMILVLYVVAKICLIGIRIGNNFDLVTITIAEVITFVVFVALAGILPGRVIRRALTILNNEMEHKKTFVRYISHEIRSPLSTATLGLEYLIEQLKSSSNNSNINKETVCEVLNDSKLSCDIATKTLNDLLMFDKIESNMLEIETMVTKSWHFVVNCVKPFQYQARASNIHFVWDTKSNQPEIMNSFIQVDAFKIEQVVRNFISNAFKFTPENGTVSLHLSVRPDFSNRAISPRVGQPNNDKRVLRFEVRDTGPGLHATNLKKLFGQYVQFDANKLQGGKGSGLGLWLSKAIIEMHGGCIGATSEGVGKGCTFYFELPCNTGRGISSFHTSMLPPGINTSIQQGSTQPDALQVQFTNRGPVPQKNIYLRRNKSSSVIPSTPTRAVVKSSQPSTPISARSTNITNELAAFQHVIRDVVLNDGFDDNRSVGSSSTVHSRRSRASFHSNNGLSPRINSKEVIQHIADTIGDDLNSCNDNDVELTQSNNNRQSYHLSNHNLHNGIEHLESIRVVGSVRDVFNSNIESVSHQQQLLFHSHFMNASDLNPHLLEQPLPNGEVSILSNKSLDEDLDNTSTLRNLQKKAAAKELLIKEVTDAAPSGSTDIESSHTVSTSHSASKSFLHRLSNMATLSSYSNNNHSNRQQQPRHHPHQLSTNADEEDSVRRRASVFLQPSQSPPKDISYRTSPIEQALMVKENNYVSSPNRCLTIANSSVTSKAHTIYEVSHAALEEFSITNNMNHEHSETNSDGMLPTTADFLPTNVSMSEKAPSLQFPWLIAKDSTSFRSKSEGTYIKTSCKDLIKELSGNNILRNADSPKTEKLYQGASSPNTMSTNPGHSLLNAFSGSGDECGQSNAYTEGNSLNSTNKRNGRDASSVVTISSILARTRSRSEDFSSTFVNCNDEPRLPIMDILRRSSKEDRHSPNNHNTNFNNNSSKNNNNSNSNMGDSFKNDFENNNEKNGGNSIRLNPHSSFHMFGVDSHDQLIAAAEEQSSNSNNLNLRVLLVDDSALSRKMMERTLIAMNCSVVHASNGSEAVQIVMNSRLRIASTQHSFKSISQGLDAITAATNNISTPMLSVFDLIITDFYMPEMNGPEAVTAIRALGYTGMVMGLTGSNTPVDTKALKDAGADMVMQKPVQLQMFKDLLLKLMRSRGVNNDTASPNSNNSNGSPIMF